MAEAVRSGSFCSSVKEELMGNNRNIKSNNILVNITCTIVFVVFTFVYLYCYQADLLTAVQHVFSKDRLTIIILSERRSSPSSFYWFSVACRGCVRG